jgi:2-polyprenyl-3-methyl-5-hydroxy-6-metoxy-1,4-benzoquinol methylase/predicted  nucleic acid-binding Zn-ribbon protein
LQFERIEPERSGRAETAEFRATDALSDVRSMVLQLVGERRSVLDIGCGSGGLARELANLECDIVGIDRDPLAIEEARRFCTHAFVSDLDAMPLVDVVGGRTFDTIVLADVLGYLREPTRVLDDCRALLGDGGAVVASIANGAHGSIRLALYAGAFANALDQTRMRFYTIKTLEELFVQAGFRIEQIERATAPIDRAKAPAGALAEIEADPECETLSFVVRATPLSNEAKYRTISKRFLQVSSELAAANQAIVQRDREIDRARTERTAGGDDRQRRLIDGLRRALDEAISQHDAVAATAAALQTKLDAMTANRDEHLSMGQHAVEQYRSTRDALAAVTQERDEARAGLATRAERIGELEVRIADLQERDVAHLDRVAALEAELAEGRETIEALDGRIAAFVTKQNADAARERSLSVAVANLETQVAGYSKHVGELIDAHEAEVEDLRRIGKGLEDEIFDAWRQMERLEATRDELIGALAEIGERYEDELERNQRLGAEVARLAIATDAAEDRERNEHLERDLRDHVARADAREAELCEDIEALRRQVEERGHEIARLGTSLEERSQALKARTREAAKTLEELELTESRLILQAEALSEATENESRRLAKLIDAVQGGPYWSLKRLSDRFWGYFSR